MLRDWLSQIKEDTRINVLAVPGTHDAASYSGISLVPALTITQQLNITKQLNAGVRVLDMRVAHVATHTTGGWGFGYITKKEEVPEDVFMCHGPIVFALKLSEALASIKAWLTKNPSEFVAMIFQQQGKKPDEAQEKKRVIGLIKKAITDAFPVEWMFSPEEGTNDWPTVGQLKKKVMVFSRLQDDFPGAFDLRAWGDNMISDQYDIPGTALKVAIQDRYKEVTNTDLTKHLTGYVYNSVDQIQQAKLLLFEKLHSQYNDDPTLKINHLSHSLKSPRYNQPYMLGTDLNKRLKASIENKDKRYRGFVMIDDAESAVCESIIHSNVIFRKDSRRGRRRAQTTDDLPLGGPPVRSVGGRPRAQTI